MNERITLYAASLYDVAQEKNCTKAVYESLKSVKKLITDDYIKLLTSTCLKNEEREGLIDEAFGENVHIFVLNFMKILAKKRLFDIFIPSVAEFEKKYFNDNNIENVTVTTAIELTHEKKREVRENIEKAIGKTVNADFRIDNEIIGGIIIQTETSLIDGSVMGKLRNIQRHISKN